MLVSESRRLTKNTLFNKSSGFVCARRSFSKTHKESDFQLSLKSRKAHQGSPGHPKRAPGHPKELLWEPMGGAWEDLEGPWGAHMGSLGDLEGPWGAKGASEQPQKRRSGNTISTISRSTAHADAMLYIYIYAEALRGAQS